MIQTKRLEYPNLPRELRNYRWESEKPGFPVPLISQKVSIHHFETPFVS